MSPLHFLQIPFVWALIGNTECVHSGPTTLSDDYCPMMDVEEADLSLLQVHMSTGVTDDKKTLSKIHALLEPSRSNTTATSRKGVFKKFVKMHGRKYTPGSLSYVLRRKLFMTRAQQAVRHNSNPDRLWTATVNKLADRTDKELRSLLGWSGPAAQGAGVVEGPPSFLQVNEVTSIHSWGHSAPAGERELPSDLSWGHLDSTRNVHNQGECGSCWAVASVSVLQAHAEIHTPQHARPLSVQELVSCVKNPRKCGGSGACDGATAELAMDYVMRHGLSTAFAQTAEAVEPGQVPRRETVACPRRSSSDSSTAHSLLESLHGVRQGSASFQSERDISAPGVHAETSTMPSASR